MAALHTHHPSHPHHYPPEAVLCVELVSGSDTVTKDGAAIWLVSSGGDCRCCRSPVAADATEEVEVLGEVGEGEGRGMPGVGEPTLTHRSASFISLPAL